MTEPVRDARVSRLDRLVTRLESLTVLEAFGLVGVALGLGLVGGIVGVAGTAIVALFLYALSGVYAFGAGQFVLATLLPARLTPELVVVELGLVFILVGGSTTHRRLGPVTLGAVALTLVAVSVGISAGGRESVVALLAGAGFVLVTGALWLFTRTVETAPAAEHSDSHAREGSQ